MWKFEEFETIASDLIWQNSEQNPIWFAMFSHIEDVRILFAFHNGKNQSSCNISAVQHQYEKRIRDGRWKKI